MLRRTIKVTQEHIDINKQKGRHAEQVVILAIMEAMPEARLAAFGLNYGHVTVNHKMYPYRTLARDRVLFYRFAAKYDEVHEGDVAEPYEFTILYDKKLGHACQLREG